MRTVRSAAPGLRFGTIALLMLAAACGRQQPAVAQEGQQKPPPEPIQELEQAPTEVDTTVAASVSAAFRAAVARSMQGVVYIEARGTVTSRPQNVGPLGELFGFGQQPQRQPFEASGSGFIFDKDRHILTNNHVVENANHLRVRFVDGREFDASVVGTDPNTDLAVLKLDTPDTVHFGITPLGDSDKMKVGDWVLALGSPLNLDFTVTSGIVSAKGRNLNILDTPTALESYIQTDAAVNPGNSGGPLVNLEGEAIGINSAIESPTREFIGYAFAIPINLAKRVASDLIKYGAVHRPMLGAYVANVTAVDAEIYSLPKVSGALVKGVQQGGPAEKAGLKLGDVVVSLDGKPITTADELTTKLAELNPGDRVQLGVIRDGKQMSIAVTLGEFPTTPQQRESSPARTSENVLGFRVTPLTPAIADQLGVQMQDRLVIAQVGQLSPAGQAGVRRGLILLQVNGQQIHSVDDLQKAADDIKPGQPVSLIVRSANEGELVINYRSPR